MPTYGYQCTQCQHEFSVFQSMKDDPIAACPDCGGKPKRLLYPVGIVFKGSGWYINDSRKPEKAEGGETKSEAKDGDSKSDATKSETAKTESSGDSTGGGTKSDAAPKSDSKPAPAAAS